MREYYEREYNKNASVRNARSDHMMDQGELRRRQILNGQKARRRRERIAKRVAMFAAVLCVIVFVFGRFALNGKAEAEKVHKFKYYTSVQLQYGESLWSLSEKYMDDELYTNASYIEEVKSINHIHDEDEVMAGKMLIVPYYSTEYIAN